MQNNIQRKIVKLFILSILITPIQISAQSVTALQEQINSLLAQISVLKRQLSDLTNPSSEQTCEISVQYIASNTKSEDVRCLQKFLNQNGYNVATTGFGSTGNETDYFGSLTQSALKKWQIANNISPTGYWNQESFNIYKTLSQPPQITQDEPALESLQAKNSIEPIETENVQKTQPLSIKSFSPTTVRDGDIVTINGTGFTTTGNTVIVRFGLIEQRIFNVTSSENGTKITFTVKKPIIPRAKISDLSEETIIYLAEALADSNVSIESLLSSQKKIEGMEISEPHIIIIENSDKKSVSSTKKINVLR